MPSAPYLMITPAIGNSANGWYFVKFGDDTTQNSTRVAEYNTYNPTNNRTSSQLQASVHYMMDGTMMKYQIFQATNPNLNRQPFVQEGATEFFQVHPKNNLGQPDATQLWPLVNGCVVTPPNLEAMLTRAADRFANMNPTTQGNVAAAIQFLDQHLPSAWRF